MKKNNYLFYSEYLKGKSLSGKEILVSKTKTSYLIGPLLNRKFDSNSFYKLTSNVYRTSKNYAGGYVSGRFMHLMEVSFMRFSIIWNSSLLK